MCTNILTEIFNEFMLGECVKVIKDGRQSTLWIAWTCSPGKC